MSDIFRLANQIKNYDWGSPDYIPCLLGKDRTGKPQAELWMGVHPGAPSETELHGKKISLGKLIADDPVHMLGKEASGIFGGLPFLFKLLAAAKPLSIQAHPDRAQAKEGWERENRTGIPIDGSNRNYRDSNHKPEIICALLPFTVMCGFRTPEEILRGLESLISPVPAPLAESLLPLTAALKNGNQALPAADRRQAVDDGTAGGAQAIRNFFTDLLEMPSNTLQELSAFIVNAAGDRANGEGRGEFDAEWKCAAHLAEFYPGDPGVIAPFYLNLIELKPGEAVYLGAGVLHSYVQGFGVELMANSDNVLRGGLSSKHIDVPELIQVVDFSPHRPEIISPPPGIMAPGISAPGIPLSGIPDDASSFFSYPGPFEEFSLSVMQNGNGTVDFPVTGPAIFIVTAGNMRLEKNDGRTEKNGGGTGNDQDLFLKQGESAFVPVCLPAGTLKCSGNFIAHIASLPQPQGGQTGPLPRA
jgi:mannose-6-phosphate isomerase